MSLRTKCAILLIAFELTLAATLILSVRYIGGYFDAAAASLARSSTAVADIGRLRTLGRNQLTQLLRYVPHPASETEARRVAGQIDAAARELEGELGSRWPQGQSPARFREAVEAARQSADAFMRVQAGGPTAESRFDPGAHLALDSALNAMESQLLRETHEFVEGNLAAQKHAALILSANMLVGAVLGVLGLFLVRRWVLLPLLELKAATDEIGRGNLEYRANVTSHDELGRLAAAVNRMSADLGRIQRQMVQRERLAAKGELMSYVAHNIRNPLAEIRSLADACRRRLNADSPLKLQHDEIVIAIDRFQRWLREVEHACSPMEIAARPTDLREIVTNVVEVFRPMAQRRHVSIEKLNGGGPHVVTVDARHFEQALAAVVGNAVEAAGDKGRVKIRIEESPEPAQWCLTVADNGPGIPAEVGQKVFEPTFTTKKAGHGLGLALARRVAELHGGQLNYDCPPHRGTIFRFQMPLIAAGATPNGPKPTSE
jgi:signal transduction histidine kinase